MRVLKFDCLIHFWFFVFVAAIKKIPIIATMRTTESVLVPNMSLSRIIDIKRIVIATISSTIPVINFQLFKMYHTAIEVDILFKKVWK